MLRHYTLIALLISGATALQAQEFCNYTTATLFDMGPGSDFQEAEAIISQEDGWMVGLGTTRDTDGGNNQYTASLVRFDVNQNLDPSFGVNGRVAHAWLDNASGLCIDRTEDGKYIIGGSQDPLTGQSGLQGFVARLNSDGSKDESFADGGATLFNLSTLRSEIFGVQARADGTIRAILHSDAPRGLIMIQLTAEGALDTTFSSNGYNINAIPEINYWANHGEVIFTADSGAIVIDYAIAGSFTRSPLIYKLDKDGEPDSLFNGTGLLVIDEVATTAADIGGILDDGYLYVHNTPNTSSGGYVVYKFDALTGEAIESFGVNGRSESTEQSAWHEIHGLIKDPGSNNILGFGAGEAADGLDSRNSVWTIDAETGEEQLNCGSIGMWDLEYEFSIRFTAAVQDPIGNIQFWGNGVGLDSTSGVDQGQNFLVPSLSEPSAMDEYNSIEFSVYPNPASDRVILKGVPRGIHSYVIYNQMGAQVSTGSYQNGIELSYLSQGLYTLRIQTDEGAWGSQRFIKE